MADPDIALVKPRPSATPDRTPFAGYVASAAPAERLPCVHTCEAIDFRSIASSRTLIGGPADRMVYFFYGRPGYRPSKTDLATRNVAYAPISLVLKREHPISPHKIFPFDSGGFESELYQRHFHPSMKLDDFLFTDPIDVAARIVTRFFGTNAEYYAGATKQPPPPDLEFEAVSYHNLINDPGPAAFDDRRGSIEVQVEHELPLTRSSVELVVAPTSYLSNPSYRETILTFWGAEIRDYSYNHDRPNAYVTHIRSIVEQFYRERRYI